MARDSPSMGKRKPTLGPFPPNRIEYWLERRGMSRKELATKIGTSEQQIGKLITGKRELTPTWMVKMAKPLRVLPTQFLPNDVIGVSYATLVGHIGKGEAYYSSPSGPWEPFDEIEAPAGLDDALAVVVDGDWLTPRYDDGDVLYFRREPRASEPEILGSDCIVCLSETRACLKLVRAGSQPGLYDLFSVMDPKGETFKPLRNTSVLWAAPVTYTKKAKR